MTLEDFSTEVAKRCYGFDDQDVDRFLQPGGDWLDRLRTLLDLIESCRMTPQEVHDLHRDRPLRRRFYALRGRRALMRRHEELTRDDADDLVRHSMDLAGETPVGTLESMMT